MFNDKRSKKVILLAHCVLNQNSKIDRCACYPGPITEVVNALVAKGIGIIQLPCPEVLFMGLSRGIIAENEQSIESEDTRVAEAMVKQANTPVFRELVRQQADLIAEYQKNGFAVLGLVGINGSPTCGVETNWADGEVAPGYGVFIKALDLACQQKGIHLNIQGIKARQGHVAADLVESMLQ